MRVTKKRCILISGLLILVLIVCWNGLKTHNKIGANLKLGKQYAAADRGLFVNTTTNDQGQTQHGNSRVNVSQGPYSSVNNITSIEASSVPVSPRIIEDTTIIAVTSTKREKVESTTNNSDISTKKTLTMNKNTIGLKSSANDSVKRENRTITSVSVMSENINNTTAVTNLDTLLNRTDADSKRNKVTIGKQYTADSLYFVDTTTTNQEQTQHSSSRVNVSQSPYSSVNTITSIEASSVTVSPRIIQNTTIIASTSTNLRKVESTTNNSEASTKKTVTMNENTIGVKTSVTDSVQRENRTITSVYVNLENINNTTAVTNLDTLLLNRTDGDSKKNNVTIQPDIANTTTVLQKADNGSSSNSEHNMNLFVAAHHLTIGRLGNQMFVYASTLGIARAQGRQLVVPSGSDLQKTFKLQHVADMPESKGWPVVSEEHGYAFDKRLMNLTLQNVSVSGYLQSRRYFQDYVDEVRQEFMFVDSVANEAYLIFHNFISQHKGSLFVGVHVRRGDFLSQYNQKLGYGVPEKSYFLKAFDWMQSKFPNRNITYLVASDDLNWCKENLTNENVIPIPDASPAVHMAILSSCDHVIISGGSYGWWSAWLSGGYVIYFKGFLSKGTTFGDKFTPSIYYPSLWVGMGN